ncbi:MAG: 4Fe-4S binding protein [Bacillus subtilis]|nr:4Fe-4S binding protein [Bacillus subtilis]
MHGPHQLHRSPTSASAARSAPRSCPVNAITGTVKQKHTIDLDKCIRCGACNKACPVNAISSKPEDWRAIVRG